jgi:uracil-DNA glycosylase
MTARLIRLEAEDDFDGWRAAARTLAAANVPADQVLWQVGEQADDLFADEGDTGGAAPPAKEGRLTVPKQFMPLARSALLHSEPQRFSLLYKLLLRVAAQPFLLSDRADKLVRRVGDLSHAVGRDIHKMRAFVRFREVPEEDGSRFVAWFEPDHHIVRANAAFFVDRFTTMRWSILTPRGSVHWDGARLLQGPPARRAEAPDADPTEAVWKSYYAAIFNPARLMTKAMLKEMPKKYWRNLPESALVGDLIAGARKREESMMESAPAPVGGAGRSKD